MVFFVEECSEARLFLTILDVYLSAGIDVLFLVGHLNTSRPLRWGILSSAVSTPHAVIMPLWEGG